MKSKTKIEKRLRKKEHPGLVKLVILLKKQKKPIWLAVAALLVRPKRKNVSVNLSKINKLTKANDVALIPGKLLASGNLEHAVTIAAFSCSKQAKEKSKNAKIISIEELLKQNPQGKNVKIII